MIDAFDSCWAVDWSGARHGYRGVAVARAPARSRVVAPVAPPGGARHWTRGALVERLCAEIAGGSRILVGFDFAFSFARGSRAALGLAPDAPPRAVWAEVEQRCAGEADHYAGAFVTGAPAGVFWRSGRRPAAWTEGFRRVDLQARLAAGVHPESMLKLVGAKQVGLASLSGMRALHALCAAAGPRVAVWPEAVRPGQSVIVEIFPTLFRRAALGGVAKIRDGATLARALAHWRARTAHAPTAERAGALSDDLTDALVSAAALRQIARAPQALARPKHPDAALEGWIFGVSP